MAVYAQLSTSQIAQFVALYDVGELLSVKGIAEGVSNSNWLIETNRSHYILTRYEHRTDPADLPYFLGLLDHLSARGCPVPRTIHDSSGGSIGQLGGNPAALIEFLSGLSVDDPTPMQAAAVGRALAGMHHGARDYAPTRENSLGSKDVEAILDGLGDPALAGIDPDLPAFVANERAWLARNADSGFPIGTIHADLFPDNVLMRGNKVGGLIDFYFSCTGPLALDLATTHASWSFGTDNEFRLETGLALVAGYNDVRAIEAAERATLPYLARQTCLRFVATRSQDWLAHDGTVLAPRKDPMEFVSRARVYAQWAEAAFGSER